MPATPDPSQSRVIAPPDIPEPEFAEDVKTRTQLTYAPNMEKGSALHEDESEFDALMRIRKRIWSQMWPGKTRYMAKIQEIHEAYEGILRVAQNDNTAHTIFPLVFMLVDTKMANVYANKPRAVFEHNLETQKVQWLEDAYYYFTTDVDDGVTLDTVDYIWHWYCELYGWSIKRVWYEVDTEIQYEPQVVTDENDVIQYGADGYAMVEYQRKAIRKGRVKHRVYDPDKVAVDPSPSVKWMYQSRDIVFVEDMSYDEWSQQYKNNPTYKNTEYVFPGKYYEQIPQNLFMTEDKNGQTSLMQSSAGLDTDRVRVEEYYNRDRCEYFVTFNGVPCLHIPNPTPYNMLPASDLHDRLRPQTFYSRGEGELTEAIIAIYQKLMNAKARRVQLAAAPVVLTDLPSGINPKSFKVYPGAHWRGMKGKVDILNMAGADTGEVTEYLQELRQLMKSVTGYDFERFTETADPTALQQEARDAAARIRVEKDAKLYENSHVRSMDLTIANIQYYMTIPEIANISDMSDEEKESLKDWDKIDQYTYRKYPVITTKGKRYIESLDKGGDSQALKLTPDPKAPKEDGLLICRPEFLRTKSRVKARAVSDRKQSRNRAIRLADLTQIWDLILNAPPKNEGAIAQAQASGQPPPAPERYANLQALIERIIDASGEDVKELTAPEDDTAEVGPAEKMMKEALAGKQLTLLPNEKQMIPPQQSGLPQQTGGGIPQPPLPAPAGK